MSTRISANQSVNHATDNQSDSDSDASSNHEQSRTESPFIVSSKIVKNQPTVVPKNDKRRKLIQVHFLSYLYSARDSEEKSEPMENDHDDDTSNVQKPYFCANDDDNSRGSSIAKQVSFSDITLIIRVTQEHNSALKTLQLALSNIKLS